MKIRILIFLIMTSQAYAYSQKQNSIVFDKATNQNILYGYGTFDVFTTDDFNHWYSSQHENYIPNATVVENLKPIIDSIYIDIIIGTWCGDCRRQIPQFHKILKALNFDMERVTIIGVNRQKVCPEANINTGDIGFVPTYIIRSHEHEIGRIIERPIESLEEGLYKILTK
ncbi:MAG: thioredoxin family protein [Bacteroidales bacterium]